MRKTLLFAFAFLLALPALATAQGGQFELTPIAGYRFSGVVTSYEDYYSEDTDLEVDESPVYGFIFDIPVGYNWQLELLANRQQTNFIFDPGLFDPSIDLGDVDIDYYHVGMIYTFGLGGQVAPFFGGSLGFARVSPEGPGIDTEDQFSGSLAGGVKLRFNQNLGVRFEGRGYWTNLDADFNDRGCRGCDLDEALYQFEANAGLIIAF